MRVHLRPLFGAHGPRWEYDWLVEEFRRLESDRYVLEENPGRADLILLTDSGPVASHMKFRSETLRLIYHPLWLAHRDRCLLYYDHDVPRPYLPGLFTEMEWFPGVEEVATNVPYFRRVEEGNPFLNEGVAGEGRDLLFSFLGRNSHPIRERLFARAPERSDVLIRDTTGAYDHFSERGDPDMQLQYAQVMRRSRWALCPRGWSVGSIRIYEAMKVGVAPVIVSDRWLPPEGLDWGRFSLRVPEEQMDKLPELLEAQGDRWREMGAAAREVYEAHFTGGRPFDFLVRRAERLLQRRKGTSTVRALAAQMAELVFHASGASSPSFSGGDPTPR